MGLSPDTSVHVCYRDMRTYGFAEDYFLEARESGVDFIRFDGDTPPAVKHSFGDLLLRVADRNMRGEDVVITPDLVVLSAGIVANPDARSLSPMIKVPLTSDGFFLEAHVKLRPCLLYTSDAADDLLCVDLGGRR